MIRKVLRALAEENFEDKHYPVLHGTKSSDVKPFVLLAKEKRPIYKRPFTKEEFKIISGLEKYVKDEKKEDFLKAVNSKKQNHDDLEVEKYDEEDSPAESYVEVGLKAANVVEGNVMIRYDLGELELGKLDEDYFDDPDLDSILQETELDKGRMKRLEDVELRLIYSVIYSERFQLKGKRQRQVDLGAGVDVPLSIMPPLKAKLKGTVKKSTIPPKAIKRNTRGPVYFKCISVVYDKEKGRLKLLKGVFAGKSVHRAVGDEDDNEYSETTLALESFENENINLAAYLTDEDSKKLDIIKEVVLMSEKQSREKRKERVKKYLAWFEGALTTGKKKLFLSDNNRLLPDDCDFIQNIFCPDPSGNQFLVDLSSLDTEKIQGYALVLKLIDDLSDEQWDEVEKAWAEPEQD